MKRFILFLLTYSIIIGCSKDSTTINGIDQEHFEESVAQMQKELPSDQAPKLEEAIFLIYAYDTHQDTEELRASRTRQILNMKDADQVFTMAEATAQRKGINWDRNSLGPLEITKLDSKDNSHKQNEESKTNAALKDAKNIHIRTKQFDKDRDGVKDGMMVFVEILDSEGNPIEYNDEPVGYDVIVYNRNNDEIFNKSQTDASSKIANTALDRGIVLPYNSFDAERMEGNTIILSVQASTPYNYYTAVEPDIKVDFENYLKNNRGKLQDLEQEKEQSQAVVRSFLINVGSGDLQQAHQYSSNPDWNDFTIFQSDDLGFGGVVNSQVISTDVKNVDPDKGKAVVEAKYIFTMKNGQSIELHKNYYLQKVSDQWKIVGTKKLN